MIRLLGFLYFITHPSFWFDESSFHKDLNDSLKSYIKNGIDFRIKDDKAVATANCYWRELDFINRKISCEVFTTYPSSYDYTGDRNLAKLVRVRPSLITQATFYVCYVILENKWEHELDDALKL